MRKILNIINPESELDYLISELSEDNYTPFTYVITEKPYKSSDIILASFREISDKRYLFKEYDFIPFIVYGQISLISRAFSLGASDFIKAPFVLDELNSRALKIFNYDRLNIKGETAFFDLSGIHFRENSIPLTEMEYKILHLLVSNKNRIVGRETFIYRLGLGEDKSRSLDVHINSLRKKLFFLMKDLSEDNFIIKTVRGKGYTINTQFTCG